MRLNLRTEGPVRRLRLSPTQWVVFSFFTAILVGTGLLMLPVSHQGRPPTLLEAAFTATSATTVTGLGVVDTGSFWTGFGQLVILGLIKIGGLGVMTFTTVLGMVILRRMSLTRRMEAAAAARTPGLGDMPSVLGALVGFSALVEGTVFVALTLRFWLGHGMEPHRAVWHGLFHAVSAFNNAGFALHAANLMDFVGDPFVCLPIAAAIVSGGLGLPVVLTLRHHLRHVERWSLTARLVLPGTALLLAGGTVMFLVLEWSNPATLGSLAPGERVLAAFFQSVTTRTAGFNTLDFGQMHPVTLLGTDLLMFIGGGPAGTAGGVKITTAAVLLAVVVTELRGEAAVNVMGRRLSRSTHREAITVIMLSATCVVVAVALLMGMTGFTTDQVLFECVSAFGTVGLSTGITADLPELCQAILMVLMFVGRIGPAVVAGSLALTTATRHFELPKERPLIG
ncbi:TrkH family potassium uptake protein [Micrococcus lylae]|uniref:TrkH family potassium uptake protein n=1 Tax=Micrococcus lylae TaxID=1273 RepID=UPI003EBE7283